MRLVSGLRACRVPGSTLRRWRTTASSSQSDSIYHQQWASFTTGYGADSTARASVAGSCTQEHRSAPVADSANVSLPAVPVQEEALASLAANDPPLGLNLSMSNSNRQDQIDIRKDQFKADAEGRSPDFEWLFFQSDMGHSAGAGTRLIDQSQHKHDFRLWSYLLQFRQRLYGVDGVVAIWQALLERGVDLPTSGPDAIVLWNGLLKAASRNQKLLQQILAYLEALHQDDCQVWVPFYETLMIHVLRANPRMVYRVDKEIPQWCPRPSGYLTRVVEVSSTKSTVQNIVRFLYKKSSVQDLYDTIMPLLYHRGQYAAAYRWHAFLTQNGDSSHETIEEFKGLLPHFEDPKIEGAPPAEPSNGLARITGKDGASSADKIRNFVREQLQEPPPLMKDHFCARCLATRAFSLDALLTGMRIIGVRVLGPSALRELAVREGSAVAIKSRIKGMREKGISIDDSKFSRLVEKLAHKGSDETLHDLLASDQHPEVLDNERLQVSLLAEALKRDDARQARMTLAVLTTLKKRPRFSEFNFMLQAHLLSRNISGAIHILNNMHEAQIPVSVFSSNMLIGCQMHQNRWRNMPIYLRSRKDGRPVALPLLLRILRSGSAINAVSWVRIIRKLGEAGCFDEVAKLAFWLTAFYGPRGQTKIRHSIRPSRDVAIAALQSTTSVHMLPRNRSGYPINPLQHIFDDRMQRLIVMWGLLKTRRVFESLYATDNDQVGHHVSLRSKPWIRGLRLVRNLANRGVAVNTNLVGRFYIRKLVGLFGAPAVGQTQLQEMMRDVRILGRPTPILPKWMSTPPERPKGNPKYIFWEP